MSTSQQQEIDNKLVRLAVEKGQLPRLLYRYRSFDEHTDASFKDGTQMFSAPVAFNDPFDCQIKDTGEFSQDEARAFMAERGMSEDQIISVILKDAQSDNALFKKIVAEAKEDAMRNAGILCLSERSDSILMWSHYANAHTGFVLSFDITVDPEFFFAPIRVDYTDEYPSYSHIREPKGIIEKGMRRKSKEWIYEKEVRIIKTKKGLRLFKKRCLSEVILGCCISQENFARVSALLADPEYEHVALKRAKVYAHEYTVTPLIVIEPPAVPKFC